jgi:hypothetical protein
MYSEWHSAGGISEVSELWHLLEPTSTNPNGLQQLILSVTPMTKSGRIIIKNHNESEKLIFSDMNSENFLLLCLHYPGLTTALLIFVYENIKGKGKDQ